MFECPEHEECSKTHYLRVYRHRCEKAKRKPTNADRIRNMTDEELAEFIYITGPPWCTHIDMCGADDDCRDCLLEWLKQEVGG